jgi:membrane protease YdiL (CAAX protease family)
MYVGGLALDRSPRKLLAFIGMTFAFSWTLAALPLALGIKSWQAEWQVVGVAIMFMPAVSAIAVQKLVCKEPLKGPLGISFKLNRWWLVAWLLPLLIAFATMGISLLVPGVSFSSDLSGFFERLERGGMPAELVERMRTQMSSFPIHAFWIALVQGLFAGVTVNAAVALGEELGWRGFLLRELGHMKFWSSSVVIGLIWGLWHAPLVLQGLNYPQHPVEGVFAMIAFCVLLSPLFSYIRLKSRSVIAAAILHGSINGVGGLSIMLIRGGDDLTTGVTGIAGLVILLIVDLFIFLLDRSIRGRTVKDIIGENSSK